MAATKLKTKEQKTIKPASPKLQRGEQASANTAGRHGKEKEQTEIGQKIRIKICAYDNKIIDIATKTIIDTAERNNAKVIGPVPLPTDIKKFSVNRSTFVHKTSAEQYEIRIHKRLIDIINISPRTVDAFMNLNLPSGVDVEIKML